ncbi:choline/glycine/proline betaine transport protein [Methylohalomonas lacus]|uniref:Choline/glycine/proline betaine transport protein n=1 Tax=Methylohalomonas lacus TaxID=398773 RepID=A0AAE3HKW9_9GAMM|nr:BCCT family transporter [Methylohalomonas lacus]MCS3904129.1 choline/glycine/proline betaine transport protein [Methylohalomonas lacus]
MSTPVKTAPLLFFPRTCRPVFIAASIIIFLFILYGTLFTAAAEQQFQTLQESITAYLGWYYILTVTTLLGIVLWLMFSRYGAIRIGRPGEQPRFSLLAWFSMLFSAGMGIGLLFWSIAEPIKHYQSPPTADPATAAAIEEAMQYSFFHWGLHAWAIYVFVALALAYFGFRHGLPLSIRSTLYPLIGERIYGPIGHVVDTFAVFGTLFGVATSLGLGAIQVNAGLHYMFDIPQSSLVQILLISIITALATLSVVLGLHRGIMRLSLFNITMAALLLAFMLFIGPTLYILNLFLESSGRYLQQLVFMSFRTGVTDNSEWTGDWTVFYWGWWLAWSPFVGMFIARVSRGRTIREFICGALLAPTVVGCFWIAVFGGTAINLEVGGAGIGEAVDQGVEMALYATLNELPWANVTALLATIVIVTFFVTSSDSGSLVIDMLTAGGDPNPPKSQRVFWAILEGVVAAILLITGGLAALQTAAIASALPFSLVILLMVVSLIRALRVEPLSHEDEPAAPDIEAVHETPDYERYD